MKRNKKETTANILKMAADKIQPCTKLRLDNIVFPKWSDIGLWGEILAMRVKTKEQPNGCDYPEATYQVVMRVIGGKVLMTGGRPDSYAWKQSKVEGYLKDPNQLRFIGVNSAAAILNLAAVLDTIQSRDEKLMFADMFSSINKDLLLITTPDESRRCIEVTAELYDAGLTYCVDSYMDPDANGEAEETILHVGDFLIVESSEKIYCVRRNEFMETYAI